jgi:putative MATE family efflux protein
VSERQQATRARPVAPRTAQSREITRLAVPALGALVAEPLFQLADSAIVGHLGAAQLAGLGAAGAALSTLVNVCIFLAYGTTSAVARRMGAGDLRGAVRQGVDGMWVALLLGAGIALVSVPLAGPIAGLFGASASATGYAVTYLRISAAGVPAMLLVLAGTGILRGLRDTRVPLAVAGLGAVVNVLLNYLLVYPAGLGIAGSATGTVITQAGMAVAYAVVAVRAARRHGARLSPDWAGIRASAGASFALLVRTAALRVYLLIAVWIAARSGTAALAAHTVATSLWNTLALALDALAIAAQAIVGHALGAGDVAGARSATARMCWWGLWLGVAAGVGVAAVRAAVHSRPRGPGPAVGGAAAGRGLPAGVRGGVRAGRGADRGGRQPFPGRGQRGHHRGVRGLRVRGPGRGRRTDRSVAGHRRVHGGPAGRAGTAGPDRALDHHRRALTRPPRARPGA